MKGLLDHIKVGFCIWDVLVLVAIVAIVAFMGYRIVKAKERRRELENELTQQSVKDSFGKGAEGPKA